MTRRAPAFLLAVLAAVLTVLGTAGPASAHATLIATDPPEGAVLAEAPSAVTFTFDEPVKLIPGGLTAYDAQGDPVDVDSRASGAEVAGSFPGDLDEGTYVVTWRVVSQDGHPLAGSLTFSVGTPSASVTPPSDQVATSAGSGTPQAVVQAVNTAALLLVGGLVVFLRWTLRGVRVPTERRRRMVLVVRGGALAAVASAALAVPLAGTYQRGTGLSGLLDPAALDPALVSADWAVLGLQVLGMAAAWWSVGRGEGPGGPGDHDVPGALAPALLMAVAIWSPSLVGHTRAYEPSTLLVLTDALHLSAGAVWLGGVVGLTVVLGAVSGRPREAALLVARFSTVAAGLLAAVAVTGLLLAWRIAGEWSVLTSQTWGRLLLVKLALVGVVVALAVWNRFGLLPRIERGGHDHRRAATRLLRRVVAVESVVLLGVVGVTGFLTQKPPTSAAATQSASAGPDVVTTAVGEDLKVLAVVDSRPGPTRRLIVQVQELATSEPVDLFEAPAVVLRSAEVDLGAIAMSPEATGTWAADVTFPVQGVWQLQVSVRIDEFTSPVVSLDLPVRG